MIRGQYVYVTSRKSGIDYPYRVQLVFGDGSFRAINPRSGFSRIFAVNQSDWRTPQQQTDRMFNDPTFVSIRQLPNGTR